MEERYFVAPEEDDFVEFYYNSFVENKYICDFNNEKVVIFTYTSITDLSINAFVYWLLKITKENSQLPIKIQKEFSVGNWELPIKTVYFANWSKDEGYTNPFPMLELQENGILLKWKDGEKFINITLEDIEKDNNIEETIKSICKYPEEFMKIVDDIGFYLCLEYSEFPYGICDEIFKKIYKAMNIETNGYNIRCRYSITGKPITSSANIIKRKLKVTNFEYSPKKILKQKIKTINKNLNTGERLFYEDETLIWYIYMDGDIKVNVDKSEFYCYPPSLAFSLTLSCSVYTSTYYNTVILPELHLLEMYKEGDYSNDQFIEFLNRWEVNLSFDKSIICQELETRINDKIKEGWNK